MPGVRLPHDPPVTLTVDGDTVVCAHTDASWWITRLASGDWLSIATGSAPHLTDRLWDPQDEFDLDDAARLAIHLTEHVTAMPWPRTVRLAAQAAHDWPVFEAWTATHAHGLDPLTAPPRRTLAAVQAMLLSGCEKEADADAMMRRLDDPNNVPGVTRTARRHVFSMTADDVAALQALPPALKGGSR